MTQYTELTKTENGNLLITLTDEGREKMEELLASNLPHINVMLELLEHHLCNGWEALRPEEIGMMTGCELILSDDVDRDDEHAVLRVGHIYWHPNYMMVDELEALCATGTFTLTGHLS
jgi:hypothetical protein